MARQLAVGVFDVQRGDVVRQQHDLVGEQLLAVGAREVARVHPAQQVDDEIAGPGARIENLHARIAQPQAELVRQHFFDGGAHEIDNFLRGVDDAVRIGDPDRIALEETLVDGIEKVLLFAEIVQAAGGVFDGVVKVVQRAQEFAAVEALAGQGGDHRLHFAGDHVALDEFGHVEHGPHQPFGEQVLDQHFVYGVPADIGVQRLLAQREKALEGRLERRVVVVRGLDPLVQPAREIGNPVFELLDGVLEIVDIRLGVAEKAVEQVGQLLGIV